MRLDLVQVTARGQPVNAPVGGPGARVDVNRASPVETFPDQFGDLVSMALRSAGVVPAGTGSGAATSVSIAGQSPLQNHGSLDGASFDGALPQEAVRHVGVMTHTYDPARGQFTGGSIAATTHSGTRDRGAALGVRLRSNPLLSSSAPSSHGSELGWGQVSGGGGGPLSRNLFGFAALEWSRSESAALSLESADPSSVARLGFTPERVQQFRDALAAIGLPADHARGTAPTRDFGTGIVRLDYKPAGDHSIALRADGRRSVSPLPSPILQMGREPAVHKSREGGLMASLDSRWGEATNVFRVYTARGASSFGAESSLPAGRVRMPSEPLPGAAFEFGGSTFRQSRGSHRHLEVSTAAQVPVGAGAHQLRTGAIVRRDERARTELPSRHGSYFFNSLDDLLVGRPASYTRALSHTSGGTSSLYSAAYLAHAARVRPSLTVIHGLRLEHVGYSAFREADGLPEVDRDAASAGIPSDLRLSPRAGFSYSNRRPSGGHVYLHGGIGQFVGRVPLSAITAPGTRGGDVVLVCVGESAPVPDWGAFTGGGEAEAPAACLDDTPLSGAVRTASFYDPGFSPPHTWRGSMNFGYFPTPYRNAGATLTVVRGAGQPLGTDLNLDRSVAFRLMDEGGRPVYAPAESIDPASGAVPALASRSNPELGRVTEFGSGGRSGAVQLTLTANALISQRTFRVLLFWYAYTNSWDEVTGVPGTWGSQPYSAGESWKAVRAPADFERRHHLSLTATELPSRQLRLSLSARVSSGTPFTPRVNSDVSGDGQHNDAAFVFDPVDAPEEIAADLERLLASAPNPAAECLRRQMGHIAARNSCRGPWSTSLDAQAVYFPGRSLTSRRTIVTLSAMNLAGLADYVVNGRNGLAGWGHGGIPDPVLLSVQGFDPERRAYRYAVNPSFGAPFASQMGRRPAFSVALQARVTVGTDPAHQHIVQTLRDHRRYPRPPSEIRREVARRALDVPATVLSLGDSLGLGLQAEQAERLHALSDSLLHRLEPLMDSLAIAGSGADTTSVPSAPARAQLRRLTAVTNDLLDSVRDEARAVLTDDQWAKLPAKVRARAAGQILVPQKPIFGERLDPW